ncbi:MAG: arsenite methyltransferase [Desulfocapsaceae bacterium]|nr:arsenite methyltransferase [Desulfocapsaceae bacterium]
MVPLGENEIRRMVRERYGRLVEGETISSGDDVNKACCTVAETEKNQSAMKLGYSAEQLEEAPPSSNMGLGCGNPLNIANLQPGEIVLDLGSGAGFDSFLAARMVGPTGKAIGIDMTAKMVEKARKNCKRGRFTNVEFKQGYIESLPIDDSSIDVIISNCVINLSPQKKKVFQEALRVLKPGGRLAIADIVALKSLPQEIRENPEMICSCIGGAEKVKTVEQILKDLGFIHLEIGLCNYNWKNGVASATIEAVKPFR